MNNDWIEWTWTEEKPYPETLETLVYVVYKDGFEGRTGQTVFDYLHNFVPEGDLYDITHYKLA